MGIFIWVLVYRILLGFKDRLSEIFITITLLTSPIYIYSSTKFHSTSFIFLFGTLGFYFLVKFKLSNFFELRNLYLATFFLAFSCSVKISSLIITLPLLIYILINRKIELWNKFKSFLIFLTTFTFLASPGFLFEFNAIFDLPIINEIQYQLAKKQSGINYSFIENYLNGILNTFASIVLIFIFFITTFLYFFSKFKFEFKHNIISIILLYFFIGYTLMAFFVKSSSFDLTTYSVVILPLILIIPIIVFLRVSDSKYFKIFFIFLYLVL